ncbi:phenylacetate--CoA ligase family protein [Psychrobacter sp. NG27]|uniref:phenylacetate--CoA ligase family protein n=1 Tax=Psychrobacter sp. NG27 TaxID=2781966 RepID=UPI0018DFE138|nr:phenylacetate--CoA ligase family protein [Psychrobacter sp. NG27]MBI0425629.1 phenylacetate--CoA ligase family protein [Psychrobacter sp. NG27]
MKLKEIFINYSPEPILNLSITIYNTYMYKIRHSNEYGYYRNYYKNADNLNKIDLQTEIEKKKSKFFEYIKTHSSWYKYYNFENISLMNVLNKQDILNHLNEIKTINEKDGLVSLTGGTTGASMKVIYTKSDMQERFAILDHFRARHGYELGKKTAWFSGKNLISDKDIKKGICSHYDFINKIRFYSTFHINERSFDTYWKSLNSFKPEFIVGFPSSVYELCKMADSKELHLTHKVKVFFPTAETVLPEHREVINRVMGCKLVDQYASSEGAPFILECEAGNMHIHPLTGIFEVVNEDMQPAQEGEILVTSFITHGTPLVRYRIGDRIKLGSNSQICDCGSLFPIVEKIEGRSTDYILSPTHGKVNLGNISNSTKNVNGIIKFQVIQNFLDRVQVLIVTNDRFNIIEQDKFVAALQERLGLQIDISIENVNDIPTEKSGKFRIVKNLLGK